MSHFTVHFTPGQRGAAIDAVGVTPGLDLLNFLRRETGDPLTMDDLPRFETAMAFDPDPIVYVSADVAERSERFGQVTHVHVRVASGQLNKYVVRKIVSTSHGPTVLAILDKDRLIANWLAADAPLDWRDGGGSGGDPDQAPDDPTGGMGVMLGGLIGSIVASGASE